MESRSDYQWKSETASLGAPLCKQLDIILNSTDLPTPTTARTATVHTTNKMHIYTILKHS